MEREIISLAASILLIVILVRFRVDLGLTMLAGAALIEVYVWPHLLWAASPLG